jgi:hypothetical protein
MQILANNQAELLQLFEVEELEARLENKWEASASTTTGPTGTTCTATIKCTF